MRKFPDQVIQDITNYNIRYTPRPGIRIGAKKDFLTLKAEECFSPLLNMDACSWNYNLENDTEYGEVNKPIIANGGLLIWYGSHPYLI